MNHAHLGAWTGGGCTSHSPQSRELRALSRESFWFAAKILKLCQQAQAGMQRWHTRCAGFSELCWVRRGIEGGMPGWQAQACATQLGKVQLGMQHAETWQASSHETGGPGCQVSGPAMPTWGLGDWRAAHGPHPSSGQLGTCCREASCGHEKSRDLLEKLRQACWAAWTFSLNVPSLVAS